MWQMDVYSTFFTLLSWWVKYLDLFNPCLFFCADAAWYGNYLIYLLHTYIATDNKTYTVVWTQSKIAEKVDKSLVNIRNTKVSNIYFSISIIT